jgi:hypothetical protein
MTETRIDPYRFVGPSAEELRGKTPAEQDALIETRRSEWERVKPLEIARQDARRAHIGAGGDAATFDAQWAGGGETAHIAAEAKRRQERARQESSIF